MDSCLNNKKILFVVSQLKVGGAAKMIKYVANLCSSFFYEVAMVTYYDVYTPDDLNSSIKRKNLNVKVTKIPVWRIKALSRLRHIIKEGKYDVVCSFLPDVSTMSRLSTIGLKTKTISAERGDPYQFSLFWRTIIRWTYRQSDYCVFQLDQARDFFDKKTVKHSFVIPNPYVPVHNVNPYEGKRKKTIVSAGRFAPQKRFDVLIRAFAIVHKKHPDYSLVLYGEGDSLSEYIELVKKLKIDKYVEFPGYINNIPASICKDGMFVLSSDYEGIPNSLIEAMSVGLPVVATDCTPGGAAFLTKKGERGLLIPVHDEEAMANAICELIDNPEKASYYSKKAVEVVKQLDIQEIDKMWIDAFTTILQNNGK